MSLLNPDEVYQTGVVAHVCRVMEKPDGSLRLLGQGLRRVRVQKYIQQEPYLRVRVALAPENVQSDEKERELTTSIQENMLTWVDQNPDMPDELAAMVKRVADARRLTYLVAACLEMPFPDAQKLLEIDEIAQKLIYLRSRLKRTGRETCSD